MAHLICRIISIIEWIPRVEAGVDLFVYELHRYFCYEDVKKKLFILPHSYPKGTTLVVGQQAKDSKSDFYIVEWNCAFLLE